MWKTVELSSVATVTAGQSPKGKHYNKEGRGTPFYQGKKDYGERYLKEPTVWTEVVTKLAEKDDILMSVRAPVGSLNISTQQICIGRGLAAIRPSTEILHDFLFYSLLLISQQLKGNVGIGFNSINKAQIEAIKIPLPPLAEQKRIVAKLDAAFAEIDNTSELEEEKLKSVQALVGAKLESMFNDARFEERRLKNVCKFVGGSQPPKSTFEYEKTDENIRLIQIRDYKSDKHLTYIPKEKAKRWCTETDVMIGRYGPPIFQILRGIEGAYNVALMKAIPSDELDNDYLFYFLSNRKIQNYVINKSSRAAGQSGVNKDALEPYPINVPPKEKQLLIVRETKYLIEQTKSIENCCMEKLEALASLKLAILSQELQLSEAA